MGNPRDLSLDDHIINSNEQPQPLYLQIKRLILRKINSGEWNVNYHIPSEKDLAATFKVSRMTVNRALRELANQGVLARIQGVGTFVTSNKSESALMSVKDIVDEIKSRKNHKPKTEIVLLEQCQATAEQAIIFNIVPNELIYHSILLYYDNEQPILLDDRYVNSHVAPEYLNQNFMINTPHIYLSAVAPLTEGEHVVEAVLPSMQEAAWLQISISEPCLQMRRKTWSAKEVVTCARLLYPGSRHRLEGHFYA